MSGGNERGPRVMLVLGIDPGTAITGYGAVAAEGRGLRVVDYGAIRTPAELSPSRRLMEIFDGILGLIMALKPDALAVEQVFFNKNVGTALAVGQARGVGMLAAAQQGLPVHEFTPLQVKMAVTGFGQAAKQQVQYMVKTILNLPELPRPDDAADALAVAICCHNHRGSPALMEIRG